MYQNNSELAFSDDSKELLKIWDRRKNLFVYLFILIFFSFHENVKLLDS